MIDAARKPVLDGICETVCRTLALVKLLDADVILDEARRFALGRVFFGHADDEVMKALGTQPVCLSVAREYRELSAAEIMSVDASVRLTLWPAHCASMPETLFGAQWRASLERALVEDRGGKPN